MTREQCIEAFGAVTGKYPTHDEIKTMRPDSEAALNDCNEAFHQEMSDWR